MGIECYTSKKCPFGRRALIALKEKGLDFKQIDIPLSGELKKLADGQSIEEWPDVAAANKLKEDYKKDINPSGEVPTLVVDGNKIFEADVVVEYLEDANPDKGESLMPKDALQRSAIRHYLKVLSGPGGVSGMYGMLMNQDKTKDEEIRGKVYAQFEKFAALANAEGPYFLGAQISIADVLLMPMYDQFKSTWPHFRGVELIPSDVAAYPWAARLQSWAKAVEQRESFKEFSFGDENYIKAYGGYAGARGVSKFGE